MSAQITFEIVTLTGICPSCSGECWTNRRGSRDPFDASLDEHHDPGCRWAVPCQTCRCPIETPGVIAHFIACGDSMPWEEES